MKTIDRRQHLGIASALAAILLLSACGVSSASGNTSVSAQAAAAAPTATRQPTRTPAPAATATRKATSAPAPTATRKPASTPAPTATAVKKASSAGDSIPIKPLADLSSLNATVTINADGTLNGKQTQGELVAELTTNDQKESMIVVTGSLLGDVIAQVGGAAVSLFRPSKVTVYNVPEGTYVVVSGLFDVCVKPKDPKAAEALDQLSPQSLMNVLANNDVARGKLVGEKTVNGKAAKHYVIDGKSFLAAAQKSSDPNVRSFGKFLRSAQDADLYVDAKGGYPLSYRGGYNGTLDALKFDGDFDVQIDLTGVNANTPINLPGACDNPISQ